MGKSTQDVMLSLMIVVSILHIIMVNGRNAMKPLLQKEPCTATYVAKQTSTFYSFMQWHTRIPLKFELVCMHKLKIHH